MTACPSCGAGTASTSTPADPSRPSVAELELAARQADRARDDAARTYRGLVYAADEAWRPLGGRP